MIYSFIMTDKNCERERVNLYRSANHKLTINWPALSQSQVKSFYECNLKYFVICVRNRISLFTKIEIQKKIPIHDKSKAGSTFRSHKISHDWLDIHWEENTTNNRNNALSSKTRTTANKQNNYKLTRAATILEKKLTISHLLLYYWLLLSWY